MSADLGLRTDSPFAYLLSYLLEKYLVAAQPLVNLRQVDRGELQRAVDFFQTEQSTEGRGESSRSGLFVGRNGSQARRNTHWQL